MRLYVSTWSHAGHQSFGGAVGGSTRNCVVRRVRGLAGSVDELSAVGPVFARLREAAIVIKGRSARYGESVIVARLSKLAQRLLGLIRGGNDSSRPRSANVSTSAVAAMPELRRS